MACACEYIEKQTHNRVERRQAVSSDNRRRHRPRNSFVTIPQVQVSAHYVEHFGVTCHSIAAANMPFVVKRDNLNVKLH